MKASQVQHAARLRAADAVEAELAEPPEGLATHDQRIYATELERVVRRLRAGAL